MDGKRFGKRLLCLALIAVLSLVMLPAAQVSAAGGKAVSGATREKYVYKNAGTLKSGVYTNLRKNDGVYNSDYTQYTGTIYCYKITVPENGFIKITYKSRKDYYNGTLYLLPALSKCKASLGPSENSVNAWTKLDEGGEYFTVYAAVNKGTYNISGGYGIERAKYSFYKSGATTNFCKARASYLEAKKNKVLCFNKGYEYSRWYKIKLTSKKTITVIDKSYDTWHAGDFTVYDSKGNSISCPYLDGDTYRKAKQPKGTYYIRVTAPSYSHERGRIRSISWK